MKITQASRAWRAGPMIYEERPQLGTVMQGGGLGQTIQQALEDLDNMILWYRRETARLESFRTALKMESERSTPEEPRPRPPPMDDFR